MPNLLGDIGTIEWCRRTNGILGRGERARFTAATVLATTRAMPRLLAARAGRGASAGGPDPSALTPPDTPFTREVLDACADLDPMLVEHGYRSYLYARALGQVDGVTCDDEALFAAAILHDYAFGEMDTISGKCFTLVGAEVAADLLATSPLSEVLRHDVLDAITLHLNPRSASSRAPSSISSTTGSSSTCSASAPPSSTRPAPAASRSTIRATASTAAASRCCAPMATASTAAAPARCWRPASAWR